MTDEDNGGTVEFGGRSVEIDTGFYSVTVEGDPDDALGDVLDAANDAADRARADVEELDDRLDSDNVDDNHYA